MPLFSPAVNFFQCDKLANFVFRETLFEISFPRLFNERNFPPNLGIHNRGNFSYCCCGKEMTERKGNCVCEFLLCFVSFPLRKINNSKRDLCCVLCKVHFYDFLLTRSHSSHSLPSCKIMFRPRVSRPMRRGLFQAS